jgi:hypothetical protein
MTDKQAVLTLARELGVEVRLTTIGPMQNIDIPSPDGQVWACSGCTGIYGHSSHPINRKAMWQGVLIDLADGLTEADPEDEDPEDED